ncbi:hypothetical protein EG834_17630, partial [bacterium]|nr:hypothetical protein [bacterium]
MVEIRAADLRFTLTEAAEFLNGLYQLALTADQVATLEQRTEGWIAGLQMAALSLQGRDPVSFFESFAGDNRYIADYLIEEVLQRQTAPMREFLLRTSILEQFSEPLCAALVEDAAAAREHLDNLERANLFLISLDNHREWYRYHHLFADLLRQRLRATHSQAEVASLQRAAYEWHKLQGDIPRAVRHARLIPDDTLAWQLLKQNAATFFQRGTLPQLFELAGAFPVRLRETAPDLCAAVAWAALASNYFDAVDEWLKAVERHFVIPAESALDDLSIDPARRAALLEVLVIRLQLPSHPFTVERILAIR